jgi:hypothetical protein
MTRGRLAGPAGSQRTKHASVTFTAEEFEAVKAKAFDAHLTVSTYLRAVILDALKEGAKKRK